MSSLASLARRAQLIACGVGGVRSFCSAYRLSVWCGALVGQGDWPIVPHVVCLERMAVVIGFV